MDYSESRVPSYFLLPSLTFVPGLFGYFAPPGVYVQLLVATARCHCDTVCSLRHHGRTPEEGRSQDELPLRRLVPIYPHSSSNTQDSRLALRGMFGVEMVTMISLRGSSAAQPDVITTVDLAPRASSPSLISSPFHPVPSRLGTESCSPRHCLATCIRAPHRPIPLIPQSGLRIASSGNGLAIGNATSRQRQR